MGFSVDLRRCQVLGLVGFGLSRGWGVRPPGPCRCGSCWLPLRRGRRSAWSVCTSGVVLLIAAWALLGRVIRGPEPPTPRALLVVLAVWAAPLLLAPPLFSRDVYSYLAQGAMVDAHIDVYTHGPARLGGPLADEVAPVWQHTATPYGPVFLAVASALSGLTRARSTGRTVRDAGGRAARRGADGRRPAPARPAQRRRPGRRAVARRAQPARAAAPRRRRAQRRHHARAAGRRAGGRARAAGPSSAPCSSRSPPWSRRPPLLGLAAVVALQVRGRARPGPNGRGDHGWPRRSPPPRPRPPSPARDTAGSAALRHPSLTRRTGRPPASSAAPPAPCSRTSAATWRPSPSRLARRSDSCVTVVVVLAHMAAPPTAQPGVRARPQPGRRGRPRPRDPPLVRPVGPVPHRRRRTEHLRYAAGSPPPRGVLALAVLPSGSPPDPEQLVLAVSGGVLAVVVLWQAHQTSRTRRPWSARHERRPETSAAHRPRPARSSSSVLAAAVTVFTATVPLLRDWFDLRVYHGAIDAWVHHGGRIYDYLVPGTTYGFTYPPFAAVAMLPMALLGLHAAIARQPAAQPGGARPWSCASLVGRAAAPPVRLVRLRRSPSACWPCSNRSATPSASARSTSCCWPSSSPTPGCCPPGAAAGRASASASPPRSSSRPRSSSCCCCSPGAGAPPRSRRPSPRPPPRAGGLGRPRTPPASTGPRRCGTPSRIGRLAYVSNQSLQGVLARLADPARTEPCRLGAGRVLAVLGVWAWRVRRAVAAGD